MFNVRLQSNYFFKKFYMFRHFVSKHKDGMINILYLSHTHPNNILKHLRKFNNNITTHDDNII